MHLDFALPVTFLSIGHNIISYIGQTNAHTTSLTKVINPGPDTQLTHTRPMALSSL